MSEFDACIIDDITPKNIQLSARYKRSFAYYTLQERLPVIITKVIDYLARDKENIIAKNGQESREEIKHVIGSLSKLKTDLQTNKKLSAISDNGADATLWNDFLKSFPKPQDFYTTAFLYAECYMYRRIKEAFQLTSTLREFDYFQKQKDESLVQAQFAVNTIAKHISQTRNVSSFDNQFLENEFLRLLHLCLWGNRCDLSISAGNANSQTTDPLASLTSLEDKIIVNDSLLIWNYFEDIRKSHGTKCHTTIIDFVTDNAGYEFFTDLCLADFLLHYKFAYQIRFLVKAFPWYISDVTLRDFEHVIKSLRDSCDSSTSALGQRLFEYIEHKRFVVIVDGFWTTPYEFCKMQEINKELYDTLSESAFVFFKGDLNHRKLLADKNWNYSTDFKSVLEGFLPTTVCTLRTIKCDLISGLDQRKYDELHESHCGDSWMITGEYAVIQCAIK